MELNALLAALFVAGCILTVVANAITILLTPRPHCAWCHVRGVGRVLVFSGAMCGLIRAVATPWYPTWDVVIFAVGIGVLAAMRMRELWLRGKAKEREGEQQIEEAGA